jgi:hypothetical protein
LLSSNMMREARQRPAPLAIHAPPQGQRTAVDAQK